MARRSVWVGGVCDFMLVKKKTSISRCLFAKKQNKTSVAHVCVCVSRVLASAFYK